MVSYLFLPYQRPTSLASSLHYLVILKLVMVKACLLKTGLVIAVLHHTHVNIKCLCE